MADVAQHRYGLLVLDYDGTLAESDAAVGHCLGAVLRARGLPAPGPEQVRATIGLSLPATFRHFAPGLAEAEVEACVADYRSLYLEEGLPRMALYPGVARTLERLHRAGVRLAVLSNRGHEVLAECLRQQGLAGFLDLALGDAPGRPRKPDPASYQGEVRPAFPHIAPGRTLVVGDTGIDLALARAAGLACCLAAYGYGGYGGLAALPAPGPEHVIASFPDLAALVLGTPA